jgi:dUTP pyrophosphatase
VIDRDYTGEVKVLLMNLSSEPVEVEVNERIAQLILKKIETPEVVEVEELTETLRGSGGFGSTG